ncbi:MAG: hypothetical protein JST31_01295 [Actinobacteria bacterium]|nr:hypothetical protein [Actinomycetota bacterium]
MERRLRGELFGDGGKRRWRRWPERPRRALLYLWLWPILLAALLSLVAGHVRGPTAVAATSSGASGVRFVPAAAHSSARPRPIRPAPRRAGANVPPPLRQGCMIGVHGTRSGRCLYGDPHGKLSIFLFGDSHALQYFPALEAIAKRNRWRLYVLTKRECTPAEVTVLGKGGGPYRTCDAWRNASLKRIDASGRPTTVVLSGDAATIALGPAGEALGGVADAEALERGYVRTLRRIRGAGIGGVVIHDDPQAPTDVPSCVAANPSRPAACNFPRPHSFDRNFDLRAARRVAGTRIVNPDSRICPHGVCQAVIGGILVYRDDAHLTADFARTLQSLLEPGLRAASGGR